MTRRRGCPGVWSYCGRASPDQKVDASRHGLLRGLDRIGGRLRSRRCLAASFCERFLRVRGSRWDRMVSVHPRFLFRRAPRRGNACRPRRRLGRVAGVRHIAAIVPGVPLGLIVGTAANLVRERRRDEPRQATKRNPWHVPNTPRFQASGRNSRVTDGLSPHNDCILTRNRPPSQQRPIASLTAASWAGTKSRCASPPRLPRRQACRRRQCPAPAGPGRRCRDR